MTDQPRDVDVWAARKLIELWEYEDALEGTHLQAREIARLAEKIAAHTEAAVKEKEAEVNELWEELARIIRWPADGPLPRADNMLPAVVGLLATIPSYQAQVRDLTARLAAAEAELDRLRKERLASMLGRKLASLEGDRDELARRVKRLDGVADMALSTENFKLEEELTRLKAAFAQARQVIANKVKEATSSAETYSVMDLLDIDAALTSPPGGPPPPLTMGTYEGWKGSD